MIILDRLKSEFLPQPKSPFPRCEHRSPAGRQCSQPVCTISPKFCFTHKPDPDQLLTDELTGAAGTLSTPEEIHNFLTKVTLLRAQGRITPKESGNYAYLCQILQRNLRDIAFHQKLRSDQAEREAQQARSKDPFGGWHLPRPDRDGPSNPPVVTHEPAPSAVINHLEDTFVGAGLACPESSRGARPLFDAAHTNPAPQFADAAHTTPPRPTTTAGEPARRSRALCGEGGPAPTETTPPQTSHQTPESLAPSTTPSNKSPKLSESSTSSPSSTSLTSVVSPDFYNHFHPIDPSIPPHLQDKNKNIPHPDEAECARLNARRGFPNSRLYRNASNRLSTFWRR